MGLLSILLFFVYTWGLGYTVQRLSRISVEKIDDFELHLFRLGIGIAGVPLLGLLLSVLHIPVDFRIFLAIGLLGPGIFLFLDHRKKKLLFSFHLTKSKIFLLGVLVLFLFNLWMYATGAFSYDLLENEDPWSHAVGVLYTSTEKTFFNPHGRIHYLDPYPPMYDGLLGILQQTSASLSWTLKFFNAFLISFSVVFFYLLVKHMTKKPALALISATVLSFIPAYMSHFIWAHAVIPLYLFISFLFLERIAVDRRWMFIAALPIAALILSTITQTFKFLMLFFIYLAVKSLIAKKIDLDILLAGYMGGVLSFLWWASLSVRLGGPFALLQKLGLSEDRVSLSLSFFEGPLFLVVLVLAILLPFVIYLAIRKFAPKLEHGWIAASIPVLLLACYLFVYSSVDEIGTADRVYDFVDSFSIPAGNMINNPIGLGSLALIFFVIAVLYLHYFLFAAFRRARKDHQRLETIGNVILGISVICFIIATFSFSSFKYEKIFQ